MIDNGQKKVNRHLHIDIVTGLMIVYMIYGHCAQHAALTESALYKWLGHVLYFFMPYFFFKSGIFHNTNKRPAEIWRTGMVRLIRPFVVFTLIGQAVYSIIMYQSGDTNWIHYILSPFKGLAMYGSIAGNLALWFLPSLFAVRWLYSLCCTKAGGVKTDLCLVIIGIGAGNVLCYFLSVPYWIANVCTGMCYYALGHLMRERQYNKKIFVAALVIYALSLVFPSSVDMRSNTLHEGVYLLWGVYSLAGIVVFNNVFKAIPFSISVLRHIGRESMLYYCLHWIVFYVIRATFGAMDMQLLSSYWMFAIYVVADILLLPLAFFLSRGSKLKSWCLGEKDTTKTQA